MLSVLLLGVALPPPQVQSSLSEGPIRSMLVIEDVAGSGRRPFVKDLVEHRRAIQGLPGPQGGEEWWPGTPMVRPFKLLQSEEGKFRLSPGSYAVAGLESSQDQVLLLEAEGHRHLLVDGVPRVGDVYSQGFTLIPVRFTQGPHFLWFKAGRGALAARLTRPPAAVFLSDRDVTLPQILIGEIQNLWGAVIVIDASGETRRDLRLIARVDDGPPVSTALPALHPLEVRKCAFAMAPASGDGASHALRLSLQEATVELHSLELSLEAASIDRHHRRTFVSEVDGSVQYYAVAPQIRNEEPSAPALILSLHGAGVEASGQAACYTLKDWAVLVAPTNRRPFGFDWEDWGRLDFLEVFELSAQRFRPDPLRIHLTGHSMGGHGTWQLGAHFCDRFAAIAPSAGWHDFEAYGNPTGLSKDDPIEALLARAAHPSRTTLLEDNFSRDAVYVLHGDQDDNVPVEMARTMRARLGQFHKNFAYYEQKGAGHWWGNECMDFTPLMEFLRQSRMSPPEQRLRVQFTTVNPAVSARCDWVLVEAQRRSLDPSRVEAAVDPSAHRLEVKTENVARLRLDLWSFQGSTPSGAFALTIDGQQWQSLATPAGLSLRLALAADDRWRPIVLEDQWLKGPHRAGPFKEAFQRRALLVYGTGGTQEENAWAFAKARYDSETFWYRGNGSFELASDVEVDLARVGDRNVILYGHREMHASWEDLLENCPIDVSRGAVTLADGRSFKGTDLAVLLVYPNECSSESLVGLVAGTGLEAMRSTDQIPYFISGLHFPDWTVFRASVWQDETKSVEAAGFFDNQWQLDPDQSAFRQ